MNIFGEKSVFAGLPKKSQETLLAAATLKKYRKSETIFNEGEAGVGLHFVSKGSVKILKLSEEGREHIIHILQPGDLFAEVLLFKEGSYPATAVAQEASEIGMIPNKKLEELVLQNNELALALIKALSSRLQIAQQKIRNLTLADAASKVTETLRQQFFQNGKELANGSLSIYLPMSRQDLASLIGISRETLTRILAEWQAEKKVSWEGKYLIVTSGFLVK
jgi:cAMP-binding proteins - catabolite gene activator and regulatory subunit of cAMP-dependent protein kinases